MFDEIAPKEPPEDIFDTLDKNGIPPNPLVEQKPPSPPAQTFVPHPQPPKPEMYHPSKSSKSSFGKIFLLIVVGFIIVAFAGFIAYKILIRPTTKTILMPEEPTTEEGQGRAPAANDTQKNEQANTSKTEQEESSQTVPASTDTDKDGLSDEREEALGTDPKRTDTDDDGLFDKEEIDVYKTDALSSDTDGDGYRDGDEVSNGYNPNGEGKLFDLPTE